MREGVAAQVRSLTDIGNATLNEMMRAYEKSIIQQALTDAQGSVSRAALLLGISHQSLIHMLGSRHRDLLALRTPVKTRKRSIMTKRTDRFQALPETERTGKGLGE